MLQVKHAERSVKRWQTQPRPAKAIARRFFTSTCLPEPRFNDSMDSPGFSMVRLGIALAAAFFSLTATAQELPMVESAPAQPLRVQISRLIQALDYFGQPLSDAEIHGLSSGGTPGDAEWVAAVQGVLDRRCVAAVNISPESRVSAVQGPAALELNEGDDVLFLVKVINKAGVTAPLRVISTEAAIDAAAITERPLAERLSGQVLEYRVVAVRSENSGQVASVLQFDVGQGSQDVGFRSDLALTFTAAAAHPVTLKLYEEGSDEPITAALEIRDAIGNVHPSQSRRVAPDFRFHPQVYRANGETLRLPVGKYQVHLSRGPEYIPKTLTYEVTDLVNQEWDLSLKRWIDPSTLGWWSGDHHIHAAGCKHYLVPSEGVHAPDMFRHIHGEDLKVGANLTWGPCFDYQKQFFTGEIDKVSKYPYMLRYDVEVSGFGSHRSGHLCLLRLKDQIYPGGDSSDHWPTLCLNTLRWAQKQGAVCGPAHSGWGLAVKSDQLPNYELPPFDGIGANEYIVDVTHEVPGPDGEPVPAVDFLSMVDTPHIWELNIWYHTLNCGYRTRISGETDFPCIYGERVGLGRSYIKLDGELDYDSWCEGISRGRGYVSDGLSHLMEMKVNDVELGTAGSEVHLGKPGTISVSAKVAARLNEQPLQLSEIPHGRLQRDKPEIAAQDYTKKPYWHLERARISDSRNVKVELVINGHPVAEQIITADGSLTDLVFDNVRIDQSSWVAMRILPSSHTNPVFVIVDDQPIQPSKRSAEWCLKSVEQCWSQKQPLIDPKEMDQAKADYEHAREAYRKVLAGAMGE